MIEINRLTEKYKDYHNAYNRLMEGLKIETKSAIVIDGVIQRFEFTFELSWKLMKAYLEYQGFKDVNSPRSTIRAAFQNEIIENGDDWIDMMIDRNKTSHIYDEEQAREIYEKIKNKHHFNFKKLNEYMQHKV